MSIEDAFRNVINSIRIGYKKFPLRIETKSFGLFAHKNQNDIENKIEINLK